jgi:hypothetical protein
VRIAEDNLNSRRVVESMAGDWVRTEDEDPELNWPETKGGGRKKILSWVYKAPE